jgi:hypothetical protein
MYKILNKKGPESLTNLFTCKSEVTNHSLWSTSRHSRFLSCKRKIKDPRTQRFRQAETSSGGSLGLPKYGSVDRKLVTHMFCFSQCKNIVSVQTKYQGKMWPDEVTQELGYMLRSCIKKLLNWYILATLKSKPTGKRREKELYLSSLNQCIYVMVKLLFHN